MRSKRSQKQQEPPSRTLVKRILLVVSLTVAALSLIGSTTLLTSTTAFAAAAKQYLAAEPADATVGQVYYNTTTNREYIYNGQEWVPHDASIDTYVLKKVTVPSVPSVDSGGSSQTATPSTDQGVSQ